MEPTAAQPQLFSCPEPPSDRRVVNARCAIRTAEGHRVIAVAGVVMASYAVGDRAAEAYAMVSLVDGGWARQAEVARAFDRSTRTVRRYQRRFDEGGLASLARPPGYPQGRVRLSTARVRAVERMKASGESNREIARRLGVSEKAVRKQLRRLGWKEATAEQLLLPIDPPTPATGGSASADPNVSAPADGGSAAAGDEATSGTEAGAIPGPQGADPNVSAPGVESDDEPLPVSLDPDPADRRVDRLLAYLGMLDDAAPVFRSAERVPQAGVLIALPALIDSGVFALAREVYGSLGPAFYGLRTTVLAMLLMALLRIKRPEGLKEVSPIDLGRVLGLDRAPEVKTLRRKLTRLGALGRAADFGRALAQHRVAARGTALGFLYLDGHVRVYHGKHRLPKAHVTRLRISLPATTDYWVNDSSGEPLLVVTAEANAGLARMLPPILREIRSLVGSRRTTIVFDRGGYSPKLFRKMIDEGFDVLTYRRGRSSAIPEDQFVRHAQMVDGRRIVYRLADGHADLLRGKLRMRQIVRLCDNGHQTVILTSREDLAPAELACRMFDRWRQENFFKYLKEEYALDALADYSVEPDDPERSVPNPARKTIDAELRLARTEVAKLEAAYGAAALANPEQKRRTIRGFKIAHGKLGKPLRAAMKYVAEVEARRAKIPPRVPVHKTTEEQIVKLSTERKLLTNLIKMVAFQAESDLVRMLAPHYARTDDEGRTLVQNALATPADIDVREDELHVRLAPLSAPHRTRALAALCEDLNQTNVIFPGTRLRIRYAVADHE